MLLQTTEEHLPTDKDKVRRIQTLGKENKDAMLECESGFHLSEDKRKLNCHKLRSSYVTSILITKLTFAMFLLKLSTLSAAIFLFVSLVLSLLCVYYRSTQRSRSTKYPLFGLKFSWLGT